MGARGLPGLAGRVSLRAVGLIDETHRGLDIVLSTFQWEPLSTNSSLGLMTKNNIKEHLNWLLISKSSKPLQQEPSALGTETELSLGAIPANDSQEPLLETYGLDANKSINYAYSSDQHLRSQSQKLLPPQLSMIERNGDGMARLQSGPKSAKKPKLLSQACADSLQNPKSYQNQDVTTSLRDRYCAPYTQKAIGNEFLD